MTRFRLTISALLFGSVQEEDKEELYRRTQELLDRTAYGYEESVDLSFGGRMKSIYMEIPENADEIGGFWTCIRHRGSRSLTLDRGRPCWLRKQLKIWGLRWEIGCCFWIMTGMSFP